MRIVYMGTPDFSVPALRALCEENEVAAVVTQPDKPVGRKAQLQPSAVKKAALEAGIPVLQPTRLKAPEFFRQLADLRPDVIVVAAYGKIIPKSILDLPKLGCINIHASLLPKYRGAAPIQWSILNGETETGVTIMQMNEGLDTGDMLAVSKTEISPEETGGSLFQKLSAEGARLITEVLPRLARGEIVPQPQPEESPTPYARMIKKEDGHMDWSRDANFLERQVRGLSPWPGTFTFLEGKTCKIWKSRVAGKEETADSIRAIIQGHNNSASVPGTVLSAGNSGVCIQTGSGVLCVTELQLAGKKRMKAADFLRGHAIQAGTVLG